MELLDPMHIRQRKGEAFPLFRRDERIDIDGVNRLIAVCIATTVAKGLPPSGETRQEHIGHDSSSFSRDPGQRLAARPRLSNIADVAALVKSAGRAPLLVPPHPPPGPSCRAASQPYGLRDSSGNGSRP
jgi:hypothetical protein